MREWYRIQVKAAAAGESAAPTAAEVFIFGAIGASFWDPDAVGADKFAHALAQLPDSVTAIVVRVNSIGGDAFEATAMANVLLDQRLSKGRTVTVRIEGLAASAATIITAVGSPIQIAENALLMVHDPSAMAFGTAGDHRKLADTLDKVRDSLIVSYQRTSSHTTEELRAMLEAETWMDADEAIAHGFATEKFGAADLEEADGVAAALPAPMLAQLRVPERFRDRVAAIVRPAEAQPLPTPPARQAGVQPLNAAEVLRLCGRADIFAIAESLIAAEAPLAQVQARIAHATEIRALCARSNASALATGYIEAHVPVPIVKAQLLHITAAIDNGITIDSTLPVEGTLPAQVNVNAIYQARNTPAAGR
jgi:ATP-dependent protease ClpP protease subunit